MLVRSKPPPLARLQLSLRSILSSVKNLGEGTYGEEKDSRRMVSRSETGKTGSRMRFNGESKQTKLGPNQDISQSPACSFAH